MPEWRVAEEIYHRHQVGVIEVKAHYVRVLHEGGRSVAFCHQVEVGGGLVGQRGTTVRAISKAGDRDAPALGALLLPAGRNSIEIAIFRMVQEATDDVFVVNNEVDRKRGKFFLPRSLKLRTGIKSRVGVALFGTNQRISLYGVYSVNIDRERGGRGVGSHSIDVGFSRLGNNGVILQGKNSGVIGVIHTDPFRCVVASRNLRIGRKRRGLRDCLSTAPGTGG